MTHVAESISKNRIVAQRIRFLREVPRGSQVLKKFVDPESYFVTADPISLEGLLGVSSVPDSVDELYFLFLPTGSTEAKDWQKQVEPWINQSVSESAKPTIESHVGTERVLWRAGRVLLQGSPEHLDEILSALVDFTFYEGELRKLERQAHNDLRLAQEDVSLTHGVDASDLKRQAHVNERTRRTHLARIQFVRLRSHLENISRHLPGTAGLMVEQLAAKAEVSDRLEALDDQLEVLGDLYETANDRLTEFRYFRGESFLEYWVIFLLALEVVLILVELYMNRPLTP